MQGIPADWDEHEINARFSLAGQISQVHFIKSATGQKTGKLCIEYAEESSAEKAISRFNNQAVEGQVCTVKPFIKPGNIGHDESPAKRKDMLARRVYLMNIPYKATSAEIESLASEFAEVDQVVIPRDK